MENGNHQPNPLFSMWIRPRATIQYIIESNPEHLVLVLTALWGFSSVLSQASSGSWGDTMDLPQILVISAVVGPICGILGLYLAAEAIRLSGNRLGGKASSEHIRAATIWSQIPVIWGLLLWIPLLAIFDETIFVSDTSEARVRLESNPILIIVFFGIGLIKIATEIWAFVIFFKSLGQVQHFSAWKAVGNTLLASLILLLPILFVVLLIIVVSALMS